MIGGWELLQILYHITSLAGPGSGFSLYKLFGWPSGNGGMLKIPCSMYGYPFCANHFLCMGAMFMRRLISHSAGKTRCAGVCFFGTISCEGLRSLSSLGSKPDSLRDLGKWCGEEPRSAADTWIGNCAAMFSAQLYNFGTPSTSNFW